MSSGAGTDYRVRTRAFEWLEEQVARNGDVLPRAVLAEGFAFDGEQIRLVGPQGIFKPRCMELPLSITTSPDSPYEDEFDDAGLLRYRYRGVDPQHRDNVGLRHAMQRGCPLVYLHGILTGQYLAAWPVFVVADNPIQHTFTVAMDDASVFSHRVAEQVAGEGMGSQSEQTGRRAYITRTFRQRLHQRSFRERVLRAYSNRCALCRLRHHELLDAAHIVPDTEPGGEPVVPNGLALCKLHHAAFDRFFLAVRDDYIVEVRADVLKERDGPMLIHGLQGMHGQPIVLPRQRELRPDPALLLKRYERFRSAG